MKFKHIDKDLNNPVILSNILYKNIQFNLKNNSSIVFEDGTTLDTLLTYNVVDVNFAREITVNLIKNIKTINTTSNDEWFYNNFKGFVLSPSIKNINSNQLQYNISYNNFFDTYNSYNTIQLDTVDGGTHLKTNNKSTSDLKYSYANFLIDYAHTNNITFGTFNDNILFKDSTWTFNESTVF